MAERGNAFYHQKLLDIANHEYEAAQTNETYLKARAEADELMDLMGKELYIINGLRKLSLVNIRAIRDAQEAHALYEANLMDAVKRAVELKAASLEYSFGTEQLQYELQLGIGEYESDTYLTEYDQLSNSAA